MEHHQPVAVLIDEYDSSITRNLSNPEHAKEIREELGVFFEVLKSVGKSRGFTFITGIVEFEQTSIFSALNDLRDLTLNRQYAAICGFTIDEYLNYFEEHSKLLLNSLKNDKFFSENSTI